MADMTSHLPWKLKYVGCIGTGTAGMALAGPIFQWAESKISAHYVHTIIIFSALHALDPNEAIMVWNYQRRLTLVLFIILLWCFQINYIPQDVFTFKVLIQIRIWIKKQKVRVFILQVMTPGQK